MEIFSGDGSVIYERAVGGSKGRRKLYGNVLRMIHECIIYTVEIYLSLDLIYRVQSTQRKEQWRNPSKALPCRIMCWCWDGWFWFLETRGPLSCGHVCFLFMFNNIDINLQNTIFWQRMYLTNWFYCFRIMMGYLALLKYWWLWWEWTLQWKETAMRKILNLRS